MPVVIEGVEITGFLSHAKTRLDLGRGSYALVGENGAGKSSIVDAIRLALMTSDRIRGGLGSLVSTSAPQAGQASVTLRLRDTESGAGYIVRVRVARNGKREAELHVEANGSRRRLATGVNAVARELARLLGIPPSPGRQRLELLEYTAVLPQGRLSVIMDELLSSSARLRERLEKILGIEEYRRARSFLESNVEIGGYALRKRLPERLARERRLLEERLGEQERLAARIEAEIRELEARAAEARRRLEGLQAARDEYQGLTGRLEALRASLAQAEAEASRLRAEVERLEAEVERLEGLEAEYQRLLRLASAEGLLSEYLRLASSLDSVRREVERLEKALEVLEELPRLEEAARRHGLLQERERALQERLRGLEAELGRAEERLGKLQEDARALQRAAESVERALRAAGWAGGGGSPRDLAEAARAEVDRLYGRARELGRRAEELRAEARSARRRAGEAREQAARLRSLRGERCPLCGSPLPRERALRLAGSLEEEAERLEAEAERLEGEAGRLEREARRLERLARSLERALAALEQAAQRAPGEAELEALEARIRSLERERGKARAELARVRSEASKLGEAAARYSEALGSLRGLGVEASPEARAEVERRLARLRGEASELEEKLRSVESEILGVTGASSLGEAEREIRRARARLRRVEEAVREAGRVRGQLEEKRRALGELSARIEALRGEIGELEGRLRALEPQVREYERLRGELEVLEGRLQRRRGELEQLRASMGELRARVEELGALAVKAARAVRILEVLERAPPLVLESKLELLSRYMSEALSSFGLDLVQASLTASSEGVTLTLTRSDGRPARVGELSGGEKTAVALSFVVALARLHAIRAGFLVLDEPTAELDRERRRTLVDVLRRLGEAAGVEQLVVVTHDDDVAEAADVICRVSKSRGVSRVDCG